MRSGIRVIVVVAAVVLQVVSSPPTASANCVASAGTPESPATASTVTCDTEPPNPYPNGISSDGLSNGVSVTVASGSGIDVVGDVAVRLRNTSALDSAGDLVSDRNAIRVQDDNTVTNSGTVHSTENRGIFARNLNVIDNSGTITSPMDSTIDAGNQNRITNSGSLEAGTGAVMEVGDSNAITNSGSMVSLAGAGVELGNSNQISNSGTVMSVSDVAIDAGNGNLITNSNLIEGGGSKPAIVAGTTTTVINRGTIRGGGTTAIRFAAGTNVVQIDEGSVIEGLVDGGSGMDTAVLLGSGSLAASFRNFELLQMAGSDWSITEDAAFDDVEVVSGTLHIDATVTATATADEGGTLAGGGTIVGALFNDGVIAPGNSVGTLRVTGAFANRENGTLVIEADETGVDLLEVSGVVFLDGTLRLDSEIDFVGDVVTAGNVIVGDFASVESASRSAAIVSVGSNNVAAASMGSGSVDARFETGLQNSFIFLRSLSGRLHDVRREARQGGDAAAMAPSPRLYAFNDLGGSAIPRQLAAMSAPYDAKSEGGLSAWARGVGSFGDRDGDAGGLGHDYKIYGLSVGIDSGLGDSGWTFGGAFSYTQSQADVDANAGSSDAKYYQFGAYAGWDRGIAFLDLALGGGYSINDEARSVITGGSLATASADHDNGNFGLRAAGGLNFDVWKLDLRPWASLDYAWIGYSDYTERDARLGNASVGGVDLMGLRVAAALAVSHAWEFGDDAERGLRLVPELRGGVVGNIAIGDRDVVVAFPSLGGQGVVQARDQSEALGLVGGGMTLWWHEHFGAYADYGGEFGSGIQNHTVSGGVRLAF